MNGGEAPGLAATGGVVAALALVHLFVGKLRFLDVVPRSRWLSFAGGVAVAYVFVHILPELAARQGRLGPTAISMREVELYLVAMIGLAAFYGLERMVRTWRTSKRAEPARFWLHVGSFAIYNALVGYLLIHREAQGAASLAFYAAAMAFHFLASDFGLHHDYADAYDRAARWVLAMAVACGWVLGLTIAASDLVVASLFAFLAGGVVLNVLKEELPEERRSRFLPFAAGMAGYAALLLLGG